MLATFTRLTSDEEIPADEAVSPARREDRGPHALLRRPAALRTGPVLWMLTAIAMLAIAVVASRSSNGVACVKSWAVACARPAPARSFRPVCKAAAGQVLPLDVPAPRAAA